MSRRNSRMHPGYYESSQIVSLFESYALSDGLDRAFSLYVFIFTR